MPTFDSAVSFAGEDQTTATSVAAWTIASTADRFGISGMASTDFGVSEVHNDMLIGTGGGDSMTQLGTTSTINSTQFSRWNLYGSSLPASGSSRILYGALDQVTSVVCIAGAVYNGVHQSTPVGDSDFATGSTTASTTIAPGDGLTNTLTTVSGDIVVGIIAVQCSGIVTVSSVSGTGVSDRARSAQTLTHIFIVEVTASGTSTTIAPTITFSGSTDAEFEMRTYVLQAAAGGGGGNVLMGQCCT